MEMKYEKKGEVKWSAQIIYAVASNHDYIISYNECMDVHN